MNKELTDRLDRYAVCVGELYEYSVNVYRQVKGDLIELKHRCHVEDLDYKPYSKYFLDKCREQRESRQNE